MSFIEALRLFGLMIVFWVMFIPVDRGMNSGWDLPLGIRGLIWLAGRLKQRL